jgi:hypothetical protein
MLAMTGLLRYARNDEVASSRFALLAMTGQLHYIKYPSTKFAQLIIFFARRALLFPEPVAANHSLS